MAQAAASTCDICTAGPCKHYCQQCNQLFSGSCKLSQLRATSCKSHTFLSGRKIIQKEKRLCTEHTESFLFYCRNCDTPVCIICSVEKHSRHLMTDLTKSTIKLKSELAKIIESKITASRQNINKIEIETNTYREIVKTVIKTITNEGNYWKNLIDKKVESLIQVVQDKELKETQNMNTYIEVYNEVVENAQTRQKNMMTMETATDVLLLKQLQQLKTDVDQIVLKKIPDAPFLTYRKMELSGENGCQLKSQKYSPEVKAACIWCAITVNVASTRRHCGTLLKQNYRSQGPEDLIAAFKQKDYVLRKSSMKVIK